MVTKFLGSGVEIEDTRSEDEKLIFDIKTRIRKYFALADSKAKADKEMKSIKKSLLEDWNKVPNEYKTVALPSSVTVAGQSFKKVQGTIRMDDIVLIFKQRVDTTLSREGLYSLIDRRIKDAPTESERDFLKSVKNDIDRMLNPHLTDVVEPRRIVKKK
jgi:hypothetical protein